MKVLLLQSSLGSYFQATFPLGLAYLAACLNKHEVRILDLNVVPDPKKELRNVTENFKPDIIGISFRNFDSQTRLNFKYFYRENFQEDVKMIKNVCSDVPLVVGGSAFSLFAQEIMEENTMIDYGIYLEGEESFPELLDNLGTPQRVKGVFYRENGQVKFTGNRSLIDFSSLPSPNRDLVDMNLYTHLEGIGVQTTRGCRYHCSYCVYPFLNGAKLRLRSVSSVVDEIEELVTKYKISKFFFADSSFGIALKYAQDICQEIIKRGLDVQWGAYFDMNCDGTFLLLAQKAGCIWFIFSPDGYSTTALKGLGKNLTHQQVKKQMNSLLNRHEFQKVEILYSFMINPPMETLYGLLATLFMIYRKKMGFILRKQKNFKVFYSWIRIEPFTKVYEFACKQGDLPSGKSLLPELYENSDHIFYRHPKLYLFDSFLLGLKKLLKNIKKVF